MAVLKDHARPHAGPIKSIDFVRNSYHFRKLPLKEQDIINGFHEISSRLLAPKTIAFHNGQSRLRGHTGADPSKADVVDITEFRAFLAPEKYLGFGGSTAQIAMMHYFLAYGSPSAAAHLDGIGLFLKPLLLSGSEAQKAEYIPKIVDGRLTGCFALTEPDCGSAISEMRTTYSYEGGVYTLRGAKNFITNGPIADIAVVFARGADGKFTAFIVPKKDGDKQGFVPGKPLEKTCWKASDTSSVHFDDVELGQENVLGGVGQGLHIAITTLLYGRVKIAAEAAGVAARIMDEVLDFAMARKALGSPTLSENSTFQYELGKISQDVQAARDTVLCAAYLADMETEDGKVPSFAYEATMAKNFAGRVALKTAEWGVKWCGGAALMEDSAVAALAANARSYSIVEGAESVLDWYLGSSIARVPK